MKTTASKNSNIRIPVKCDKRNVFGSVHGQQGCKEDVELHCDRSVIRAGGQQKMGTKKMCGQF